MGKHGYMYVGFRDSIYPTTAPKHRADTDQERAERFHASNQWGV